jgi:hypothetical protein
MKWVRVFRTPGDVATSAELTPWVTSTSKAYSLGVRPSSGQSLDVDALKKGTNQSVFAKMAVAPSKAG